MSLYPRVPNRRGRLLDPLDPGGFSTQESSSFSALTAPVGPGGVNRSADVGRIENLLSRSGDLAPKARAARGLFDPPVEAGVRAFQVRRGLKPDGLLNPGGPTETALVRQAAQLDGLAPRPAPPRLPGLSGEGAASNARSVRHLAATRENGLFPDLLTQDARAGGGDRSLAVDFFAQLRRADHERAEQIRREMALDPEEDRTFFADVDKLLEAETFDETTRRLADGPRPLGDADDNDDDGGIGTPPDDGDDGDGDGDDGRDDGDDGDEKPPYDPDHPEPGDPDDPDEPEEPEPDCSEEVLRVSKATEDLARAEAARGEILQSIGNVNNAIFDLKSEVAEKENQADHIEVQGGMGSLLPGDLGNAIGVSAMAVVSALRVEIANLKREIKAKEEELGDLKRQLEQVKAEIKELEAALAEAKDGLDACRTR